jgi:hypothetical protein
MSRFWKPWLSVAVGAAALLVATPGGAAEWEWEGVERVVAIGDVHGAYEKLVSLLRGMELVGADMAWTGGGTHLVFCGDLIDRGPQERPVLDLVRGLEAEAEKAGGRVHVVLGNHEVMNLARDLRYVPPEGFAAFAAEESEEERERAWKRFTRGALRKGQIPDRLVFDERFPPGFFARMRAFEGDGEYGAWLLAKPAVVKVNGVLFLHGGLTEEMAALGLEEVNRRVQENVRDFMIHADVLEEAAGGIVDFGVLVDEAPRMARSGPPEQREAARALLDLVEGPAFAPDGPLWFRGYSLENERLEQVPLRNALKATGARAMVVAHTPTAYGKITSRFNRTLYRADTGMAYGGNPFALSFEGTEVAVFDPADGRLAPPPKEMPSGERWQIVHPQLPDRELERFLQRAKVVKKTDIEDRDEDRHVLLLELERKGLRLRAIFHFLDEGQGSPNPRRYQHELAAYWLDRRLGLELAPVTAERKVDGQKGAAWVFLESAFDLETIRQAEDWGILSGLEPQIGRAGLFTALVGIGRRERHEAAKMVLPMERRIMLADNTKAFPTTTEVDEMLADEYVTWDREGEVKRFQWPVCPYLDASLSARLSSLSLKELRSNVGRYLSKAQMEALLTRRDRILETCAAKGASSEVTPGAR